MLEGLTASVRGQASDYVAALDRSIDATNDLGSSAAGLSASLGVLSGRADDAAHELNQTDRAAERTNRSFVSLIASSEGLAVALGTVSGVSMTSVLPAIGAITAALIPLAGILTVLTAGAAALGGAFGIVVGAGVVTHMSELKTAAMEAKTEIIALLQPLGEVMGPVLVDAVEALPELVANILEVIGPVDEFRDTLVEWGQIAMEVIPQVIGGMFNLAREALPVFENLVEWLGKHGPGAFRTLMRIGRRSLQVLDRIAPVFVDLGKAIQEAMPFMKQIGRQVLPVLGGAVLGIVKGITRLIEIWNGLGENLKIALFVSIAAVIGVLASGVLGLVAAIAAVTVAWNELKPVAQDVIAAIQDAFWSMVSVAKSVLSSVVTLITKDLPKGIITGLSYLVAIFESTFNRIYNTIAPIVQSIKELIATGIEGIVNTAISALNTFLGTVDDVADTVESVTGQSMPDFGQFDKVDIATESGFERRTTDIGKLAAAREQQLSGAIEVVIESDDEKFNAEVKRTAGAVTRREMSGESRTADRLEGRPGGV